MVIYHCFIILLFFKIQFYTCLFATLQKLIPHQTWVTYILNAVFNIREINQSQA